MVRGGKQTCGRQMMLPPGVITDATHPELRGCLFPSEQPLVGNKDTEALVAAIPGWNVTAEEIEWFRQIYPTMISTMSTGEYQLYFDSICWAYRALSNSAANDDDAQLEFEKMSFSSDSSSSIASRTNSTAGSPDYSRSSSPISARSSCTSATSGSTHGLGPSMEALPVKFQEVQMTLRNASTVACLFDTDEEESLEDEASTQIAGEPDISDLVANAVEPGMLELLKLVVPDEAKKHELFAMAISIENAAAKTGVTQVQAAEHLFRVLDMYVRRSWVKLAADTNPRNPIAREYVINNRHTKKDVGIRWRQLYECFQAHIDAAARTFTDQQAKASAKAQVYKAMARHAGSGSQHVRTQSKPLVFRPDLEFRPDHEVKPARDASVSVGTFYPGVPDYLAPLIARLDFLARFEACITRPRWDRLVQYANEDHDCVLEPYVLASMREIAFATCVYYSRQMHFSEYEKPRARPAIR